MRKSTGRNDQADRHDDGRLLLETDDPREHQKRPVPEIERVADQPDINERAVAEENAVGPRILARCDQQNRTCHRQQRPPPGKRAVAVDHHHRRCKQQQSRPPHPFFVLNGMTNAGLEQRENRASTQFPEAGERKKKRGNRIVGGLHETAEERQNRQHDRNRNRRATACDHDQDQRPNQIELLFDA